MTMPREVVMLNDTLHPKLVADLLAAFGSDHDGTAWVTLGTIREAMADGDPARADDAFDAAVLARDPRELLAILLMTCMCAFEDVVDEESAVLALTFAIDLCDRWLAHRPAPVVH